MLCVAGVFSIFSVVNFPNKDCRATENEDGGARSGLMGTCLSSTECNDISGMKRGSCASGFGVCCVKTLKECGGTVSNVSSLLFICAMKLAIYLGCSR